MLYFHFMRKSIFPATIFLLLLIWAGYFYTFNLQPDQVFSFGYPMMITMFFGSFIAGATSEGGGAVAFPVMTLLLAIPSADARIFSLGCQSFGMTAASALILSKNYPIVRSSILPVSFFGIIGFILSDLFIVPILSGAVVKLFFVSLWLAFGVALWWMNKTSGQHKSTALSFHRKSATFSLLFVFGFIGGGISALFGNGIDIITFTLLTLVFRIDEKIATPTSVILMTIMTIFGFLWHLLYKADMTVATESYWLAAVPVAMLMAPLGAWVVSKLKTNHVVFILYFTIVAQFITALYVIKPSVSLIVFSLSVIFIGLSIFRMMSYVNKYFK